MMMMMMITANNKDLNTTGLIALSVETIGHKMDIIIVDDISD